MNEQTHKVLAILSIVALLVAAILAISGLVALAQPAPKAEIKEVKTIEYVTIPSNVSTANDDITAIKNEVLADDIWEADATKLAEAEWNTNKKIFNALQDLLISISDKEDISKVVIHDTDVNSIDADEKDATVEQEVRVYYEDESGEHLRANLIVTTEIVEGEAQDAEYILA